MSRKIITSIALAAAASMAMADGKDMETSPKNVSFPPEPQCPKGYDLNDKECIRVVEGPGSCPKGYTERRSGSKKNDGVCVRVETAKSIPTCPAGYDIRGNICVAEEEVPGSIRCPMGGTDNNDNSTCTIVRTLQKQASVTYVTETAAPDADCPKGYTDDGAGNCLLTRSVPKVPHVEYTVDTTAPDTYCPGSLTDNGNGCTMSVNKVTRYETVTETAPYDRTCGGSYNDDGTGCSRTIVREKIAHRTAVQVPCELESECPPGFDISSKGDCTRTISVPHETTYESVMVDCPVDKSGFCPKGCTSVGGNSKDSKEPTSCVRQERVPTQFCPKGTEEAGKECVRVVSAPMNTSCPKGCSSVGGGLKGSKNQQCVRTEYNVEYECPGDSVENGKDCATVVTSSYDYECPKGFSSFGNGKSKGEGECVKRIAVPVEECPKGFTDNGKDCVSDVRQYETTCPKGYSFDGKDKGQCTRRVPVTTYECPKGTEDNGKDCVTVTNAPPLFSCPKGFTSSGNGKSKEVSECIRRVPVTEYNCPKGTEDNGKECITTSVVQGTFVCPYGSQSNKNGSCTTVNTAPLDEVCPKDYTLSKNGCVRTEEVPMEITQNVLTAPIQYVCPPGTVNQKGQCEPVVQNTKKSSGWW